LKFGIKIHNRLCISVKKDAKPLGAPEKGVVGKEWRCFCVTMIGNLSQIKKATTHLNEFYLV
jgi:hypothetical protein